MIQFYHRVIFIIFSSIIVKRNILLESGKINENLNYCEDLDLILRVLRDGHEAIGLENSLTSYRIHGNNLTYTKEYDNHMEVVNMLNTYVKQNNLSLTLKYHIYMNNSYRIGSVFIKLLLKKEFSNIKKIVIKYSFYLLIFPLSILKIKLQHAYK
jgi:GT2 family glycosyltransferase